MKMRDVLNAKDIKYRKPITINPDESVLSAIRKLAENDRGAIPVCNDDGTLVGIITERDILRKCFSQSGDFINNRIQGVMTETVVIALPDDNVDYAIDVMKKKRIRHIPVMEGQQLMGMISMRDIMGFQYEETKAEIRYAYLLARKSRPR
ncbi:CBS domain-containing protein [Chloroflexota bacterium]